MQKNLFAATDGLATIVTRTDEALKSIDSTLKGHLDELATLTEKLNAEVKKINGIALDVTQDTEEYLTDFNTTGKESMRIIGETIGGFKVALNDRTVKSIQTLAASLTKISGQMIDNYKVPLSRIAELDEVLAEMRRAK